MLSFSKWVLGIKLMSPCLHGKYFTAHPFLHPWYRYFNSLALESYLCATSLVACVDWLSKEMQPGTLSNSCHFPEWEYWATLNVSSGLTVSRFSSIGTKSSLWWPLKVLPLLSELCQCYFFALKKQHSRVITGSELTPAPSTVFVNTIIFSKKLGESGKWEHRSVL